MQTPSGWCKALDDAADAVAALEELTSYGLHNHAQHLDILHCPGLVRAIVQQLQLPKSQAHAPLRTTAEQADLVQAALEAAISLTIGQEGLQALVQNGAVEAACRVLQACLPLPDMQSTKRHKHSESLHSAMIAADDEKVQDILPLAVQLLAALLLEPSPARPPVGCLDSTSAARTAATFLQALPGPCWTVLAAKLKQDAAAVFMRLAMEPGVLHTVCQQAAAAGSATQPQPTKLGSGVLDATPAQLDALSRLLGAQIPAQDFVAQYWETQPAFVSSANQQHAQQVAAAGQQQRASTAPNSAEASSASEQLAAHLTPQSVLRGLLPGALHCPVLPATFLDPVQVLQDLRTQGLLLQCLQPNTDLRIIKTQTTPLHDPSSSHGTNSTKVSSSSAIQHTAGRAGEVLLGLDGPVSTDSCVAAMQAGFTIVIRDMPKRCPAVCALVDALEEQLGLPAGANLYLTPVGAQGLKAHYDDHDVFVLQLAGSKSWVLGPPQHPQLPLTHQRRLPVAPPLQYQQSLQQQQCQPGDSPPAHLPPTVPVVPAAACSGSPVGVTAEAAGPPDAVEAPAQTIGWPRVMFLHGGDCLYIPRGWVHQAVAAGPETAGAQAPGQTADSQNALRAADGSSLHLSVGVEVAAEASVQGFLHHLIEVCTSTAAAGMCACSQHGRSAEPLINAQPPDLQQGRKVDGVTVERLAVQAAALVLHMRLWCLARAHPVYRKACPLVATGRTAQWLSNAVVAQLRTQSATASAQVASSNPDQPLQHEDSKQHRLAHQLQPQHVWVQAAVQQLTQGSSIAGFDTGLLAHLVQQVLGSAAPASATTGHAAQQAHVQSTVQGQQQDSGRAGDGLLGLYSWLEGQPSSLCSTCGSSCCHSRLACSAAVLLHVADTTFGSKPKVLEHLQGHTLGCACCLAVLIDVGEEERNHSADSVKQLCGLVQACQAAALRLQAALAGVQHSLSCGACRSKACEGYVSSARSQLASFQAVRKAFVAAEAFSRVPGVQL